MAPTLSSGINGAMVNAEAARNRGRGGGIVAGQHDRAGAERLELVHHLPCVLARLVAQRDQPAQPVRTENRNNGLVLPTSGATTRRASSPRMDAGLPAWTGAATRTGTHCLFEDKGLNLHQKTKASESGKHGNQAVSACLLVLLRSIFAWHSLPLRRRDIPSEVVVSPA